MIKYFEVEGLNGRHDYQFNFNPDLNILTGRNGAGKTTLLKLLWYMMSSNRERIFQEIDFTRAKIVTSTYTFSAWKQSGGIANFEYHEIDGKLNIAANPHGGQEQDLLEELNSIAEDSSEKTVFFPTFRRIEGGFSIGRRGMNRRPQTRTLSDCLEGLSEIMSSDSHQFVSSISTVDIEQLLLREFASISRKTNRMYVDFSKFIRERIPTEVADREANQSAAVKFMDDIRGRHKTLNENHDRLMRPFNELEKLLLGMFRYRGISVGDSLSFGDIRSRINSDLLSAGEKQMLSFLCYNAFAKESVIFIDEPELSLHVDWQRILFRTLLKQGATNQFVITTHSPFIYSAYPEKELVLSSDKGE